jgi:hypothetical protein
LDGIARFVDNETKAPVLIKERQSIASRVLIESALAESRDLSLAHPNRNEAWVDIEPTSDDSCIDAQGALFKLHYGHGLRLYPPRILSGNNFIYGMFGKEVERKYRDVAAEA